MKLVGVLPIPTKLRNQGSLPREDSTFLGVKSKLSKSETTKTLRERVQVKMRLETDSKSQEANDHIFNVA